jgi:uncharacterized membrane protein YcaP (DUF421 family)
MGLLAIALRALIAYAFLLVLVRASGKRSVSHSSPFDFVMALILGDLVDDLLWAEVGLAQFAVAAGILVMVETAVAAGQARWVWLHQWVTGEPLVLLREGRAIATALRRERVRENDLEAHLRVHGLERDRWGDLAIARLEDGGAVTIKKTARAQEVERRDLVEEPQ